MKIRLYNDNPGETLTELGNSYDDRVSKLLRQVYTDAIRENICLRDVQHLIEDASSLIRAEENLMLAHVKKQKFEPQRVFSHPEININVVDDRKMKTLKINDYITCVISDETPNGYTVYEGQIIGHVLSENLPDKHWCIRLANGRIVGLSEHRIKLNDYRYTWYVNGDRMMETFGLKYQVEHHVESYFETNEKLVLELDKEYFCDLSYSDEKVKLMIKKEIIK